MSTAQWRLDVRGLVNNPLTLDWNGFLALPQALGIPSLAVSDYKGVSYARKFPDSQR